MRTMRDAFLGRLYERMARDEKIVFLTADFGAPMLDRIKAEFPGRFYNVGIAEQNLVNVATGFALEGFTPYCYAIATFISMRCYEQVRVNLAITSQLKKMNVTLIGVGAGFSYAVSGPSHHCLEDLPLMLTLPNIDVFSPADPSTAETLVDYTLAHSGVKYLRFDSVAQPECYGAGNPPDLQRGFTELIQGKEACIVSTGAMTGAAYPEVRKTPFGLVDFFRLTGFAAAELRKALCRYQRVLCLEECFRGQGLDKLLRTLLQGSGVEVIPGGCELKYIFELGNRDHLRRCAGAHPTALIEQLSKPEGSP